MPSKYGFGNTRKKSPYTMGKASYGMDQKNPIMMKSPLLNEKGKKKETTKKGELTTFEKIKAGAKGVYAGVSRALRASATENPGYSTRVGIEEGKKTYKRNIKAYSKD